MLRMAGFHSFLWLKKYSVFCLHIFTPTRATVWLGDKESACNAGDTDSTPGLGRSLGERNGSPTSLLAWRIPWTEESGGLQSTGSQRVGQLNNNKYIHEL